MRLKQVILALFIVRFCVNISLSLLRFGIMVVREKNCYYAIALTDFFVFLSCAEARFIQLIVDAINSNQSNSFLALVIRRGSGADKSPVI